MRHCVIWVHIIACCLIPLGSGKVQTHVFLPFLFCVMSLIVLQLLHGGWWSSGTSQPSLGIQLSFILTGRCHMLRNVPDSFAPLIDCHPLYLFIRIENNISPQKFHHVFFQLHMTKSHPGQHSCSLPIFGTIAFHHFTAKYINCPCSCMPLLLKVSWSWVTHCVCYFFFPITHNKSSFWSVGQASGHSGTRKYFITCKIVVKGYCTAGGSILTFISWQITCPAENHLVWHCYLCKPFPPACIYFAQAQPWYKAFMMVIIFAGLP